MLTWHLMRKSHFHPIYALIQSLVLSILYPIILSFNAIVVASDESGMDHISTWQALCYGEMGLQAALMVCWVGMVVCSCVAVHEGRRGKGEERIRGWAREEVELKGVERRDGKGESGLV